MTAGIEGDSTSSRTGSRTTAHATSATRQAPARTAPAAVLNVPVEFYKLSNGLRVVISESHLVPAATIGVYYNIGSRLEPRGRTGFAHLFEHLMFQGSRNLPKGEFIRLAQGLGGQLNGLTHADYTEYYETFPSNALETMLWAEADRMRGLHITQENLINQQSVVKEEVTVNVLDQPYGGFPWLLLPQSANQNWHNAHDSYGDLKDIDAATLDEAEKFFDVYYTPSNAALVVAGDLDLTQTKLWIRQNFEEIPDRPPTVAPDISESRQNAERRVHRVDPLAPRPALAIGYHIPSRWTAEYFAFGVIDEVLLQGEASRLHRGLVHEWCYTDRIAGGIDDMPGNMFGHNGPTLWSASLVHDQAISDAQIIDAIDDIIERMRTECVTKQELERARCTIRSRLYDSVGPSARELANLLGCFALFDDDPSLINRIEAEFTKVTPELVLSTAQEYLRRDNRTVLALEPRHAAGASRGK